jgi:ABC-type oligopeptide transport system substrate-binding subunit
MMKQGTRVILLGAALALVGQACTKKDDDGKLQILRVPQSDDAKTLDPANAYDTISLDVLPSMVETLYNYDYAAK